METVVVAAVADNGVIGNRGDLPWHIPGDLARFKSITLGGSLVMGRATFESIGRPLPGRSTIVLTRNDSWSSEGVIVVASLDAAIERARELDGDAFVCGGAAVYREAIPIAHRMELTEVHRSPEGDTFFPQVDWSQWSEVVREDHEGFEFVSYVRV